MRVAVESEGLASMGSVEEGAASWWVAQLGVDSIDPAVLKSAVNEDSLFQWDGVIGRFATEEEAWAALERAAREQTDS